jgi:hypothetical protein
MYESVVWMTLNYWVSGITIGVGLAVSFTLNSFSLLAALLVCKEKVLIYISVQLSQILKIMCWFQETHPCTNLASVFHRAMSTIHSISFVPSNYMLPPSTCSIWVDCSLLPHMSNAIRSHPFQAFFGHYIQRPGICSLN